jgi:GTP cyclohydrolase I
MVDFDGPNGHFSKSAKGANVDGKDANDKHAIVHSEIDIDGLREEGGVQTPLRTSRAHSPYTQHPTIDFDGLSWPSMYS